MKKIKLFKKNQPKAMMAEYIPYIIARRIHSFRMGLYPTTRKIILKEISEPWINFFRISKITNIDFREIMNEYKDNKDAFYIWILHTWIHIMTAIQVFILKLVMMIYQ